MLTIEKSKSTLKTCPPKRGLLNGWVKSEIRHLLGEQWTDTAGPACTNRFLYGFLFPKIYTKDWPLESRHACFECSVSLLTNMLEKIKLMPVHLSHVEHN